MIDPFSLTLLSFFAFLTSIISAVVGMGGGIVFLSLMTFFLPLQVIVPVHGIVQLISNSTRTWFLRSHVIKPIFWWFLLGLPLGAIGSTYIIKKINDPTMGYLLIALIIMYTLFKPKKMPHLTIPYPGFVLIGAMVGFLGPLIGATGPFMAPFFLRDDFSKENIIATKSSVQTMGHLIKIPVFLSVGFPYMEHSVMIGLLTLAAVIGTKAGVLLLGEINEKIFRVIFKSALFFAAMRLFYKIYISVSAISTV
ncbi:MAG: sulfite exporter TauE/SafE family protein [Bacteriovoracaceae bacterium]|nr:sulfite exporter TauE/SafE family protein [Bacteriovoracaceae bacterium]